MLRLKFQYFGHLMGRADSLEKTLILGKIEGRRRRDDRGWDGWMASLTQWTWVWAGCRRWWRTGKPGVLQSMEAQRVGHDWATEQNRVLTVCLALFWVCDMWCLIGFAYNTGKYVLVSFPSYAWGKLRAEQQHAQRHIAVSGDAEAALFTTV